MKPKIFLIFILIAAAIYFAYRMFSPLNDTSVLAGSWKLDSVKTGADSNLIYFMLLSSMKEDSTEVDFLFSHDSLFTFTGDQADTNTYSFDERKKEVTIKSDEKEVYTFNKINDSIISLTAKDSTALYLKKIRRAK